MTTACYKASTPSPLASLVARAKRLFALTVLGLAAVLAGCSERSADWHLYEISGHLPNLRFTLDAAGGKTVTEADLKGNTVLMFFGYASCPDICPTTMAQLSEIIENLGDEGQDVRILFVSVDPHRDTPDVLQAYVNAFNPDAIGLTGDERTIRRLSRRYRVAYQILPPKPGDDPDIYDVTHSQGVFIFDANGRARLLASDSEDTAAFTEDLRKLIRMTG